MKIIAHRCGENSFAPLTVTAARHSVSAGACAAEIDVRTLADGTIVVNHDEDALALFGSPARVAELTLPDWRALRYTASPETTAQTLADFLEDPALPLVVHVKPDAVDLPTLLDQLTAHGALPRSVLGVTTPEAVRDIKQSRPSTEVLAFLPSPDQIATFAGLGADIIRLWEQWVTPERVAQVAGHGCRTWVMAGEPARSVGYTDLPNLTTWQALGVDGVLVDLVEPAVAHLQGRKDIPSP